MSLFKRETLCWQNEQRDKNRLRPAVRALGVWGGEEEEDLFMFNDTIEGPREVPR
jgi:hypothetical protein